MIKCKNPCPLAKHDNLCCSACEENKTCEEACVLDPSICEDAIIESEETGLELFKQQQSGVIQKISDLIIAKKTLEERENELKRQLKEAMEICNIKKFESDILNITYVAATTANSIDSKKLKQKYPDIAEECSKESKRSAYVKITMKGDE